MRVPYDILDLSAREADQALGIEESHTADVKAIEISPGKLTRTLAAFSNAEGGSCSLGLTKNLRWEDVGAASLS